MLARLFSCFSDNAEHQQQMDLSRQSNLQPCILKLHPESNVSGQKIQFETYDNAGFLQREYFQQIKNQEILHKFYYEGDEGQPQVSFEETKLTTASPSKNHLHKHHLEEMNPDLVQINQNNIVSRNRIEKEDFFQQQQMSSQIEGEEVVIVPAQQQTLNPTQDIGQTELTIMAVATQDKQLNTYLHQAEQLINSPVTQERRSPLVRRKHPLQTAREKSSTEKEYTSSGGSNKMPNSQRQSQMSGGNNMGQLHNSQISNTYRQSMDSSQNSQRMQFNVGAYQSTNVLDFQQVNNTDTNIQDIKTPKLSFTQQGIKPLPTKDPKKSSLKQSANKLQSLKKSKKVTLDNSAMLLKPSTPIKASIISQGKLQQISPQVLQNKLMSAKYMKGSGKNSDKLLPQSNHSSGNDTNQNNQVIEVVEEENDLKVLDYFEDGYQLDLGALKSLNKRQTSKTEAYTNLSSSNKKQNINRQSLFAGTTVINQNNQNKHKKGGHKKTNTQMPQSLKMMLIANQGIISTQVKPESQETSRNSQIQHKRNTTITGSGLDLQHKRQPSFSQKRFSLGGGFYGGLAISTPFNPSANNQGPYAQRNTRTNLQSVGKISRQSNSPLRSSIKRSMGSPEEESQREYFLRQQNSQMGSIMSTPLPHL